MQKIYQLKLTLRSSKPAVWRRLLVSEETSLEELHLIIQSCMDWDNIHLYEFEIGGYLYMKDPFPDEEDEDIRYEIENFGLYIEDEDEEDEEDGSVETKLQELGLEEKSAFSYFYNMMLNWELLIVVEKILPQEKGQFYPQCIKGKRSGPLEIFAGMKEFKYIAEALKDPAHPDHKKKKFLYRDYDPESFDQEEINRKLTEIFSSNADKS
jgi:hypothetical protein